MGELSRFLKKNKVKKENIKIAATKTLTDENGQPLLWEIRPLTTREDSDIREECTVEVQVKGKPGLYRPKLNSYRYLTRIASACIVYPNLNDKELQDSYGVMDAEHLITEMIDDPGEFNELMNRIQEYNGFAQTFKEKVEEAKN